MIIIYYFSFLCIFFANRVTNDTVAKLRPKRASTVGVDYETKK